MNKKFFAALTSAAMLLSSTGVVAFAEEFDDADVITETDYAPGVTPEEPDTTDVITLKDAFDKNVLTDLRANYPEIFKTADGKDKAKLKKDLLKDVTTVTASGVEDTKGIDLLTGLTDLTLTDGSFNTLDLSANTKLKTLKVTNDGALTNVTLPSTTTLTSVTLSGNKALTAIDLSNVGMLETAILNNNALGALDTSNNPYLKTLNVNRNSLNVLDASKNYVLNSVKAANNGLYEATLPVSVTVVDLSNNKISALDFSNLTKAADLNVSNNMLKTLKVAGIAYTNLNVSNNHLATLNLKDASGTINVANQIVYFNDGDKAVSLKDYDEAFARKDVLKKADGKFDVTDGTIDADGVLKFAKDATSASYKYNTQNASVPMEVTLVGEVLMNRLYNPNSGEHFYTKDAHEKDVLVGLGWQDEGIGWIAPKSGAPVYRLYNPNAGDHHYTMSANEKDTLVGIGWQYEGIGWYSAESVAAPVYDHIEVYREYNPNAKAAGAHNYTVSEIENDALVSLGWIDEGRAWFALK